MMVVFNQLSIYQASDPCWTPSTSDHHNSFPGRTIKLLSLMRKPRPREVEWLQLAQAGTQGSEKTLTTLNPTTWP